MRGIVRAWVVAVGLAAVLGMGGLSGCAASAPEPTREPKVAPPAIKEAGVLKAGVDLRIPPFAGQDGEQRAGIDVDVATGLAERLGLELELVEVKPSDAATALASGIADIVLSVPIAEADLAKMAVAGSYITDAPVFFRSAEDSASASEAETFTLDTVPSGKVGAQRNSAAYWLLLSELGPNSVQAFDSLREAFDAIRTGKPKMVAVAGDAVVGGYLMRDYDGISFAGQLTEAAPIGVAVAVENVTLADSLRGHLDAMAAEGVLDAVRLKWLADFPELTGGKAEQATEPTGAAEGSETVEP